MQHLTRTFSSVLLSANCSDALRRLRGVVNSHGDMASMLNEAVDLIQQQKVSALGFANVLHFAAAKEFQLKWL